MRKEVPLAITFVVGVLYVLNNALEIQLGSLSLSSLIGELNNWVLIVAAFAMGVASVNLMQLHGERIVKRREGWGHSILLIGSFGLVSVVGIFSTSFNVESLASLTDHLFTNVQAPLGAAMWAMVGFFICSSAYRAFRLRNIEATLMLIAGIVVMLGRAPIGEVIWSRFPVISKWLLDVPNTAGQRAIMIGAAIGGFATALKVVLGKDRGYLGSD